MTNHANRTGPLDDAYRAPIIVEFLGPAGVGKTTLIGVLTHHLGINAGIQLQKSHYLPFVFHELPKLLPTVLTKGPFLRREVRSMVYLSAWRGALGEVRAGTTYCFDHGPVFRLALLREFGSAPTQHPRFARWWQRTLERWATALTVIVWLDAPDEVLIERINARAEDHLFKGKGEAETRLFLGRFRAAFDEVVTELSLAAGDGPTLLHIDTSSKPIDETTAELLAAFGRPQ